MVSYSHMSNHFANQITHWANQYLHLLLLFTDTIAAYESGKLAKLLGLDVSKDDL